MRLVALAFIFALLAACSNEVSVDETFVDAFVEIRIMEVTYGSASPVARMNREDIIRKHGYTREEFLKKTDEILEDEHAWVPFQKAVVARFDTLIAQYNKPQTALPASPAPSSPGNKGESK